MTTKEPGLASLLHYDRHERRSGLVHLLPADGSTGAAAFVDATYQELGDFTEEAFVPGELTEGRVEARRLGAVRLEGDERPLEILKTYRFAGGRTDPTLELATTVDQPRRPARGLRAGRRVERQPARRRSQPGGLVRDRGRHPQPHDAPGEVAWRPPLAFGNDYEGVRIDATAEPAARLTWYPVETVSNSEGGFERVYQGSSLLFRWPIALDPRARPTFTVRFAVAQSIDHSTAELG